MLALSFLSRPFGDLGVSWLFVATFLLLQPSQRWFWCVSAAIVIQGVLGCTCDILASSKRLANTVLLQIPSNSYAISLKYLAVSVLCGKAWVYIKGESRRNGLGAPAHLYSTVKQCLRERELNLHRIWMRLWGQAKGTGWDTQWQGGWVWPTWKNYFTFMEALWYVRTFAASGCICLYLQWIRTYDIDTCFGFVYIIYYIIIYYLRTFILCKLRNKYSTCIHISSIRRLDLQKTFELLNDLI